MANNKDLVTKEILQKATQDILQSVVDHLYEYEEYTDEEISDLFNLTPEEVKSISEIINDEVISKYKIWSSKGTSDKIASAKIECQEYANDLIKNISSIQLEWCETSLPITGESNKIYILPKTVDSNIVNTLNIWNTSTTSYVTIGNLEIDLTQYFTKDEINTMLNDYAKKSEVLPIDSVIDDISTASGTNVLSASASVNELNKKIDKTSIATSVDSTSTNDEVIGAKTFYDTSIKNYNIKTYTKPEQLGLASGCTVEDIYNAMPDNSYFECGTNTSLVSGKLYVINNLPNQKGGLLTIRKYVIGRNDIQYRTTYGDGVMKDLYIAYFRGADVSGLTWQKVCTTSTKDISITNITDTLISTKASEGTLSYFVKDGICYIEIDGVKIDSTGSGGSLSSFTFPVPYANRRSGYKTIQSWQTNKVLQLSVMSDGKLAYWCGTDSVGSKFYGQISYPVAES